jgi:hypothetical protein
LSLASSDPSHEYSGANDTLCIIVGVGTVILGVGTVIVNYRTANVIIQLSRARMKVDITAVEAAF